MPLENNPGISFVYGNMLKANGKKLWADVLELPASKGFEIVTAERFSEILKVGQAAIAAVHHQMPEVLSLRLSTDPDTEGRESMRVLTPAGWDAKNPGILYNQDDLVDNFHTFWEAAIKAGYQPRARLLSGKSDGGAWLSLLKDK